MPHYQAYGLTLLSSLPLPGLLPGEGAVDVYIDIETTKSSSSHKRSPILCAGVSLNRVHLTWGEVGDLLIEDGQHITVIPVRGGDEDALRLFVLGAGLGVLLYQRGLLVFHSSGVVIENRVVGFIGAKGWGKSTMAATLYQRGHALISDELLAVHFDGQNQPRVMPGSPEIRLWSDALVSTGGDPDSAIRVRSGIDKFNVNTSAVALTEFPIRCLYLLDAGEEPSIQLMSPSEAFLGIIPHLYINRFETSFLQEAGMARTLRQLSQLLKIVNVKRLLRRRNLIQLQEIAKLVEQDACSQ